MQLVNERAEAYAAKYTSPLDKLLQENETFTLTNHPHAHMHSGFVQGKLLEMISLLLKPRKILEIGSFTGFSALCLARGLAEGGRLDTIELREEDAEIARGFFNRSDLGSRIHLHTGDATSIIPTLEDGWDLVFIDADKVGYIEYYELTLPGVNSGGWILADNVLFHGQVLEEEVKGKNAKAIQAFNAHVAADERVEQVMLTVRDGLLLIRKK
jgi:predicted O-methyltransferase YrrM